MRKGLIHTVWLLLLFCGCEVPYRPEVFDAPQRYLVVSGFINSGSAITSILLSRTRNLNEASIPLPETGAHVTIEDQSGAVVANLSEAEPGKYSSEGILKLDHSKLYRLRIKKAGKEYLSELIPVKVAPPIESLTWEARSDGLQIYVNTRDSENNTRYYRWEFEETWEFEADMSSSYEYKDGEVVLRDNSINISRCWRTELSRSIIIGNSVKLSQDIMHEVLLNWVPSTSQKHKIRYSILAKQYGLTKEGFEYWDILKRNTESIGTLFDPLPSRLTGNIKNLTNPAEPVIGFIGAGTVEDKRIFISVTELPLHWARPVNVCKIDTIDVSEAKSYLSTGGNNVISILGKSIGSFNIVTGYSIASRSCTDCRVYGTNIKPDFW